MDQPKCCVNNCAIARLAETERNIVLGCDLLALKSIYATRRSFVRMVRDSFNIDEAHAARCMLVARRYGDRRDITNCVSWATLVELSAPETPDSVRRDIEQRVIDGERVSATDIYKARLQAA
jgi:hypothetical protein